MTYWSRRTCPVIPDGDRIRLPVETHLEVRVLAELVEEQAQDGIGLGLGHADYATGETCTTHVRTSQATKAECTDQG